VWESCQRDERWLQHGSDHLLYRLLDEIANNYTKLIDQLEDDLAELEGAIFRNPAQDVLEQLFSFKRTTLRLRRVLAPQREVVNRLARDPYPVIGPKDQIFFRDVYDHFWRLYGLSENLRDLVMGSMDIYLSVVNKQMNEVMRTLTVITTLFMPLTVLTGFFGMNFFQAVAPSPSWTGQPVLILTVAIMILLPTMMFLWMRRRAWMASF
jgi:magnesium transporter